MRTHYGPWQPCWISNQHQKHKSGRGPSSEHFWQVWLISVQWFQRRRFKCEKLTDGRTLTHDKSSHGLWPSELKRKRKNNDVQNTAQKTKDRATRTPLRTGCELRFSRKVSSSCSTCGIRRVTHQGQKN